MPSVEDHPEPLITHEADHTVYRGRDARIWCAIPGCEEFDHSLSSVRCAPSVTGLAADVQKILDRYPTAVDIMEAEEADEALRAESKRMMETPEEARLQDVKNLEAHFDIELTDEERPFAADLLRSPTALYWRRAGKIDYIPRLLRQAQDMAKQAKGRIVRSNTPEGKDLAATVDIIDVIEPRTVEQQANDLVARVRDRRYQRAMTEVNELEDRLTVARAALRAFTPQPTAEELQKREEGLQAVRARRAENERLAIEEQEDFSDVEIAARVLSALDFPHLPLNDADDEGVPYWRRLIPKAELFLKAGFLHKGILLTALQQLTKETERGRYAEVGYNDHFNDGLSAAEDLIEEWRTGS